jgi:hypothetical protein
MPAKQTRDHAPDMAFLSGAGDENRTRTISLGSCTVRPLQPPDQLVRISVRYHR